MRHGDWLHGGLIVIGIAWMLLGVLAEGASTALVGACLMLSQSLLLYVRRTQEPNAMPETTRGSRRLGIGLMIMGAGLVVAVVIIAFAA